MVYPGKQKSALYEKALWYTVPMQNCLFDSFLERSDPASLPLTLVSLELKDTRRDMLSCHERVFNTALERAAVVHRQWLEAEFEAQMEDYSQLHEVLCNHEPFFFAPPGFSRFLWIVTSVQVVRPAQIPALRPPLLQHKLRVKATSLAPA